MHIAHNSRCPVPFLRRPSRLRPQSTFGMPCSVRSQTINFGSDPCAEATVTNLRRTACNVACKFNQATFSRGQCTASGRPVVASSTARDRDGVRESVVVASSLNGRFNDDVCYSTFRSPEAGPDDAFCTPRHSVSSRPNTAIKLTMQHT